MLSNPNLCLQGNYIARSPEYLEFLSKHKESWQSLSDVAALQ